MGENKENLRSLGHRSAVQPTNGRRRNGNWARPRCGWGSKEDKPTFQGRLKPGSPKPAGSIPLTWLSLYQNYGIQKHVRAGCPQPTAWAIQDHDISGCFIGTIPARSAKPIQPEAETRMGEGGSEGANEPYRADKTNLFDSIGAGVRGLLLGCVSTQGPVPGRESAKVGGV